MTVVPPPTQLTDEQRRAIEWDEGPAVVIAGAGTGKTKVIVERVKYLLETKGEASGAVDPLLPEHLLVLTYNVKAAAELRTRIEQAVGVATAARMTISNFHSFCQRILTENAADAGLPPRPDVLDGIAQVLLLKDLRPDLHLVYHGTEWWLGSFVQFINRCKDELVRPADFDAFVAEERRVFEARYGSFEVAADRLALNGNLRPLREVRKAYAWARTNERAEARGEAPEYDPDSVTKTAEPRSPPHDRRQRAGGVRRGSFAPDDLPRIDALADTYVEDGAALEILRLTELAAVYHAYEDELARRGALDFGERDRRRRPALQDADQRPASMAAASSATCSSTSSIAYRDVSNGCVRGRLVAGFGAWHRRRSYPRRSATGALHRLRGSEGPAAALLGCTRRSRVRSELTVWQAITDEKFAPLADGRARPRAHVRTRGRAQVPSVGRLPLDMG